MPEATLKDLTRPLHHAAEQHAIGGAMATGDISATQWAAWCAALLPIHAVLDLKLPVSLHRTSELIEDLNAGPVAPMNTKALSFCTTLNKQEAILGATYVFTGAHLMGGAVIERRINGRLPCAHLRWVDRRQAITDWSPLRLQAELKQAADNAFAVVISIMDEISEKVRA